MTTAVDPESEHTEQPVRRRLFLKLSAVAACLLAGWFVVYRYVLLDNDPATRPVCHKQVLTAVHNWLDRHPGKAYPNVNGSSDESLATLKEYLGEMRLHEKYKYVPGLRTDDPNDLILMYLVKPTRWRWHAHPQPVYRDKEWIVVPKDFTFFRDNVREGELNERLSFEEFRVRLKRTLEFLRKNKRPNWETVVKEHTRFLANASKQ